MNEILKNNIKSVNLNGVMVEIKCNSSESLTLVKNTMKSNTATFGSYKGSSTYPQLFTVRYTYSDTAKSESAYKRLQAIVSPAAPQETPTTAIEAIPVPEDVAQENNGEETPDAPIAEKGFSKKTLLIAGVALVALVAVVFIIKKKRK